MKYWIQYINEEKPVVKEFKDNQEVLNFVEDDDLVWDFGPIIEKDLK